MYRVLVLFVSIFYFAESGDPCMLFINKHGIECARSEIIQITIFGKGPQTDDIKECFQPNEPYTECVAIKKGYLSADGTISRTVLADLVQKDFKNNPQLAEKGQKCINADLDKGDSDKLPDLLKIELCLNFVVLKNIENWDDEGNCHGMEDLMKECINSYQ